jgi:hypothetical protein
MQFGTSQHFRRPISSILQKAPNISLMMAKKKGNVRHLREMPWGSPKLESPVQDLVKENKLQNTIPGEELLKALAR